MVVGVHFKDVEYVFFLYDRQNLWSVHWWFGGWEAWKEIGCLFVLLPAKLDQNKFQIRRKRFKEEVLDKGDVRTGKKPTSQLEGIKRVLI